VRPYHKYNQSKTDLGRGLSDTALPSKHKALSSNPSTTKKEEEEEVTMAKTVYTL
jgi:hypothetical protein